VIDTRIRVRCSNCERQLMPPPGAQGVPNDDTFDTITSAEHEAAARGWTIGEKHGDDAYCDVCGGPEPEDDWLGYSTIRTTPNCGEDGVL
jgi:hypothetical protein